MAETSARGRQKILPEVDLSGPLSVIADLHLDPFDEGRCGRFADWTRELPEPQLIVMGDLFDAWVGPAHERAPGAQRVIEAFRAVADRGEVLVLQGNRDFLLGESFEEKSGARVLPDGCIGRRPNGERVLFLHGDELCTKDLAYQRLRRITHSRFVQWLGPRVPLVLSRRIARRMRRASERAITLKLPEDKAIQEDAARARAAAHGCVTLVCGHVHVARDEALEGGPRWLILDAFGGRRDLLRVDVAGLELAASGFHSAG